ncbi:MAG TPA: RHS repeat-associated core domain-containing protein [Terriglobales bacterium]|nr:RHS repeat-associated core domain-containing protein [Terriglobales bacterium]
MRKQGAGQYDAASNRTRFTDPEGGQTDYVYDVLNRLTSLTNFQAQTFTFGYDALGRRTQLTRPNGVNTDYSYDNLSRLLSVLHKLGANVIDGATYTVDPAGNRTSKLNHLNGVTESYTYDAIYQLTQVVQNGTTTSEAYTYDKVGNRLSTLTDSNWIYNNSNQLTSRPGVTYTYDNNGNTLTKTDASGTTQYAWDYENRLTSVTLPGVGVVSFKYDPFGRRIQKVSASDTTAYVHDSADIAEELDATATAIRRYTTGLGIDEPLAMLRSGATSYYLTDGLGSVTSLIDPNGSASAVYTYQSFGELTSPEGSLANPFRYTGREFDVDTNLHYYRARYYNSLIARFLTEDPIGFNGGINFYAYVLNAPTMFTDPDGLRTQVCCRLLRGSVGKLTGKNHCYIRVTNSRGSHTYGLHREHADDSPLPNGARPLVDDPTDVGGTCSDVRDATPCKERMLIQQALSDLQCPSCGANYWAASTNSNFWVANALRNANMTPPVFPGSANAPGYSFVPPSGPTGGGHR